MPVLAATNYRITDLGTLAGDKKLAIEPLEDRIATRLAAN